MSLVRGVTVARNVMRVVDRCRLQFAGCATPQTRGDCPSSAITRRNGRDGDNRVPFRQNKVVATCSF